MLLYLIFICPPIVCLSLFICVVPKANGVTPSESSHDHHKPSTTPSMSTNPPESTPHSTPTTATTTSTTTTTVNNTSDAIHRQVSATNSISTATRSSSSNSLSSANPTPTPLPHQVDSSDPAPVSDACHKKSSIPRFRLLVESVVERIMSEFSLLNYISCSLMFL